MAKKRRVKRAFHSVANRYKGKSELVPVLAGLAAGAVGISMLSKVLPIGNDKMKAAIPLAVGAIGLGSKHVYGNSFLKHAAMGSAVLGILSLMKAFVPSMPLLAGADDVQYIPVNDEVAGQLGYSINGESADSLMGLGDDSLNDEIGFEIEGDDNL